MLVHRLVDGNTMKNQVKKEKGNFVWAKLSIITRETHSLKLWEQFHLLKVEGTFETKDVHQNDILTFHIKFTKDT